jgi:predicted anti-sigma-YlaC factor YlaD
MKCLESEDLIGYAYRLTGEPAASQVRAHLADCSRCREILKQYQHLGSVLDEWKVPGPTPEFDVHVRQAVEAHQASLSVFKFWDWQWARGLAVASLAILVVAGAVWFSRTHAKFDTATQAAVRPLPSAKSVQAPPVTATLHPVAVPGHTAKQSVHAVSKPQVTAPVLMEDRDAQALDDYDLAANFDLLSELPKGGQRVVN